MTLLAEDRKRLERKHEQFRIESNNQPRLTINERHDLIRSTAGELGRPPTIRDLSEIGPYKSRDPWITEADWYATLRSIGVETPALIVARWCVDRANSGYRTFRVNDVCRDTDLSTNQASEAIGRLRGSGAELGAETLDVANGWSIEINRELSSYIRWEVVE